MGARTGREYIDGLRDNRRVYTKGELVRDVTQHPPFQGVVRTLADLYDRQHEPTYKAVLTTPSPTSGKPVSTPFVLARTWEEMEQRVSGERLRCEFTYGLMGRLPDFMNAFVTDMAAIHPLLGRPMRWMTSPGRYRCTPPAASGAIKEVCNKEFWVSVNANH